MIHLTAISTLLFLVVIKVAYSRGYFYQYSMHRCIPNTSVAEIYVPQFTTTRVCKVRHTKANPWLGHFSIYGWERC